MEGQSTDANIDVLVWSDIVRGSMSSSIPATYLQLVRTAWTYITIGALRRLMWLRKGPVIAALYPVGMLILQLAVAALLGLWAGKLLAWALTSGAQMIIGLFWGGDTSDLDFSIFFSGGQWRNGRLARGWRGPCCVGSRRRMVSFSPII